jgi:hypothetical protein
LEQIVFREKLSNNNHKSSSPPEAPRTKLSRQKEAINRRNFSVLLLANLPFRDSIGFVCLFASFVR